MWGVWKQTLKSSRQNNAILFDENVSLHICYFLLLLEADVYSLV